MIQIKSLVREAGYKTKLAVVSTDMKVDPIGACVGVRGSRIRTVIDELNGEKIDILKWEEQPEVMIASALKPAQINAITLNYDTKTADVSVDEDQLSLAIGRRGANVRLASRLSGWDIQIAGEKPLTEPGEGGVATAVAGAEPGAPGGEAASEDEATDATATATETPEEAPPEGEPTDGAPADGSGSPA